MNDCIYQTLHSSFSALSVHPVQISDGDLECLPVTYHNVTARGIFKYSFRTKILVKIMLMHWNRFLFVEPSDSDPVQIRLDKPPP